MSREIRLTDALQTDLKETARKLRVEVIKMLAKAGSGHPGGSLGMADIFASLYFGGWLRHDPKNPLWEGRDRLVLSNGHICPILYASLAARGYFPAEWMASLRQVDAHLQGHPAMHKTPGVELSTGSLGHGVCGAVGMALALRADGGDRRVYCLTGDGELQEGLPWEGFMSAAHYKLDNLTVIVDRNDAQIDGKTTDIMNIEPLGDKFRAWGFHTIAINGHDFSQIFAALNEAERTKGKPTCIVAITQMGKGVSYMEKEGYKWHGKTPNAELAAVALKELGA
ncbi:MAG: transketolase [Planctomycetes bacterium]|nr:transketolase [Planctomycetota bacterium]